MLTELRVENLGVIAELGLVLGPGMTAVTGETGAGKTLVVEAIELLAGARADASLVRHGKTEARVEARFHIDEALREHLARSDGFDGFDPSADELVVARVVPADGRSRASVNGRLVPVGLLSELGRHLVELHGQHTHQGLLTPGAQRGALDRFAGAPATTALADYRRLRAELADVDDRLRRLGGDARERAREIDLLRFQIDEIDAAAIDDPHEDDRLREEEALLSDAGAHREAATEAHRALHEGALEALGAATAALDGRSPFDSLAQRVRVLQEEVGELAREIRQAGEGVPDDPERLEAVVARRRLLRDLGRKYGDTVADVLTYRAEVGERLRALEGAEAEGRRLEAQRVQTLDALGEAAARLSKARAGAAGRLGEAVTGVLRELAMPGATLAVSVERPDTTDFAAAPEDGFDQVMFLLAANAGEGLLPLSRVASGGELARTMLAARVVLSEAPPTLVFDEVDAGIGGQAGVAVGRKLAVVAEAHQVLCVTHLAQVAAFADSHIVVGKREERGRTLAGARPVEGTERVAELSRMLAGTGTERARDHAEELLASAARERAS